MIWFDHPTIHLWIARNKWEREWKIKSVNMIYGNNIQRDREGIGKNEEREEGKGEEREWNGRGKFTFSMSSFILTGSVSSLCKRNSSRVLRWKYCRKFQVLKRLAARNWRRYRDKIKDREDMCYEETRQQYPIRFAHLKSNTHKDLIKIKLK